VGERDLEVFRRILAGESMFDYQTRHLRRDGSHVDLSFNAVPMRDARGTVVGATGTARDITAEKIAAAAQYENVEKLRLAVDAAELMYWEWERDTDQLNWGRDPSSLVGAAGGRSSRWSEYLEIVHPDDRDRYLATVNAAWEQAGVCTNEYRVIRHDGRVAWLSSHGKTLADSAGRVLPHDRRVAGHHREEAPGGGGALPRLPRHAHPGCPTAACSMTGCARRCFSRSAATRAWR
jgi:PAS domain-containing protein